MLTQPWTVFELPADVDGLVYQTTAGQPDTRGCAMPLMIPKAPLESVALMVRDPDHAIRVITVPNLARHRSDLWIGTLPAVPSKIQIEWRTGQAFAQPASVLPTGLFFWNFGGLVIVLVCWTILYILWASRRAS